MRISCTMDLSELAQRSCRAGPGAAVTLGEPPQVRAALAGLSTRARTDDVPAAQRQQLVQAAAVTPAWPAGRSAGGLLDRHRA